jgi:hypothetical protein
MKAKALLPRTDPPPCGRCPQGNQPSVEGEEPVLRRSPANGDPSHGNRPSVEGEASFLRRAPADGDPSHGNQPSAQGEAAFPRRSPANGDPSHGNQPSTQGEAAFPRRPPAYGDPSHGNQPSAQGEAPLSRRSPAYGRRPFSKAPASSRSPVPKRLSTADLLRTPACRRSPPLAGGEHPGSRSPGQRVSLIGSRGHGHHRGSGLPPKAATSHEKPSAEAATPPQAIHEPSQPPSHERDSDEPRR